VVCWSCNVILRSGIIEKDNYLKAKNVGITMRCTMMIRVFVLCSCTRTVIESISLLLYDIILNVKFHATY